MCTHIGSDVILANLLIYSQKADYGIDYDDIEDYCKKLQAILLKSDEVKVRSVSFQVNDRELDFCLRSYPMYFKRFLGRYYRGIRLCNINNLIGLSSAPLNDIMRKVAQES